LTKIAEALTELLGEDLNSTDSLGGLLLALEHLPVGAAADRFLEVDYVAVDLLE
jgi:hypothetical protein